MGFKFGKSSLEKLATCHKDIQVVLNLAISRSNVDFGITEGFRSLEKQQAYYAIGRTVDKHKGTITNVDGINKKGKHNQSPSEAVDIYIYTSDSSYKKKIGYDEAHLSYVAGVIESCSKELKSKGKISHEIRWGGNWDSDGIIKFDQGLNDMPHFEI